MEHPTPDAIRNAIAATVRAELAAQGISGPDAARATGTSYETLRRYLAGTRDFPIATLYKMADLMNVETSTLIAQASDRMSPRRSNVTPLQPNRNFTAADIDAMSIDKAAHTDEEVTEGSTDPD